MTAWGESNDAGSDRGVFVDDGFGSGEVGPAAGGAQPAGAWARTHRRDPVLRSPTGDLLLPMGGRLRPGGRRCRGSGKGARFDVGLAGDGRRHRFRRIHFPAAGATDGSFVRPVDGVPADRGHSGLPLRAPGRFRLGGYGRGLLVGPRGGLDQTLAGCRRGVGQHSARTGKPQSSLFRRRGVCSWRCLFWWSSSPC